MQGRQVTGHKTLPISHLHKVCAAGEAGGYNSLRTPTPTSTLHLSKCVLLNDGNHGNHYAGRSRGLLQMQGTAADAGD
jgi:hypothetical protein